MARVAPNIESVRGPARTRSAAARSLLAAGLCALSLLAASAAAQTPARIGLLFSDTPQARSAFVGAYREALAGHGLTVGREVSIDTRFAGGGGERLAAEAASLAGGDHAVVLAAGTAAALALQRARPSAPMVIIGVGDPVRLGLVPALEQPGGTITGSTDQVPDTSRRRLELVREALPAARRVAIIASAQATPRGPADAAAAELGLTLVHLDVRGPKGFAAAYAALEADPPDVLIVTPNPFTFAERHRLAAFGLERRIPVMFGWREFMDAPGLIALGANLTALYVVAARQTAEILRGRAPAEMPVERPRFDLVVNQSVARKLGAAIPQAVLGRADLLIE